MEFDDTIHLCFVQYETAAETAELTQKYPQFTDHTVYMIYNYRGGLPKKKYFKHVIRYIDQDYFLRELSECVPYILQSCFPRIYIVYHKNNRTYYIKRDAIIGVEKNKENQACLKTIVREIKTDDQYQSFVTHHLNNYFIRTTSNQVVNKRYIRSMKDNHVYLINDETVPYDATGGRIVKRYLSEKKAK